MEPMRRGVYPRKKGTVGTLVTKTNKMTAHIAIFVETNGRGPQPCHFCGELVPEDKYDVHHLDHNHDNNEPSNLVAAHEDCHARHHHVGRKYGPEARANMSKAHLGKGKKTHCASGHPLAESAYRDKHGHVAYCKWCRQEGKK